MKYHAMRRSSAPNPALAPQPLRTWLLLGLVGLNIGLQLINASLIKYASQLSTARLILVGLVLVLVAALSIGRFVVWGALHKRFPVSLTYPATALFFPCLVGVAAAFGEHVSTPQWIGASLVAAGVMLLLRGSRSSADGSLS
jgi:drug/metabolite transporter (DMT)-like permease